MGILYFICYNTCTLTLAGLTLDGTCFLEFESVIVSPIPIQKLDLYFDPLLVFHLSETPFPTPQWIASLQAIRLSLVSSVAYGHASPSPSHPPCAAWDEVI